MAIAVERALDLLGIVCEAPAPLRFTDIVRRTGLPKSTVNRLLATLMARRMVAYDAEARVYRPGFGLLGLATQTWAGLDIRHAAATPMKALLETFGETVHLAALDDQAVIYLDKLESPASIRLFSAVGKRGPIYCTGIGKAILAALDDDTRERLLAGMVFAAHTPNTLTTRTALEAELATIARRGCAYDMEEHEEGIRCVAAVIRDFRGHPVAGLSVTATAKRLDRVRMTERIQPQVIAAAQQISAALGHIPAARSTAPDAGRPTKV